MDYHQIVFALLIGGVSRLCYGETQDKDCSCDHVMEKFTNIIAQMNNTLQETVSKLQHTNSIMGQLPENVAFYAYSTQSPVLGDQQTIVFDHVVTNLASGYDAQDGQFLAPVRGLYYFSTSLMAYPGHYIHAAMVHNGATISYVYASKSEDDTGTAVVNLVLQKGDKVWVKHRNDPNGVAQLEGYYSAFSGFLIQPM